MPTYQNSQGQTTTISDQQLSANPTYWSGILGSGGFQKVSDTATNVRPAPSVITSEPARTVTQKNLDTLNSYSPTGPMPGSNVNQPGGVNAYGPTKPVEPEPAPAPKETSGLTPDQQALKDATDAQAAEWQTQIDQLEQYRTQRNDLNDQMITSIQAKYANLQRMQEQFNRQEEALVRIGGLRSGRSRYASEIQSGIEASAQAAGVQRLADLAAEEQGLVLEARVAASEENFKVLNAIMESRDKINKQKVETMTEIMKNNVELEKLANQRAKDLATELRNQIEDNRKMQEFAIKNRIVSPFYEIGGQTYSSATGMPVNDEKTYKNLGGTGDGSDIQQVTGEEADNYQFVIDLRKQYPDAGIALGDDPAEAVAKLSGSRIYQDKVRGPEGSRPAPTSGFSTAKIEQDFRESVVAVKQEVRSGLKTVEDAYNDLRDLYSPSDVPDDTIKSFLGITPAGDAASVEPKEYGTDIFGKGYKSKVPLSQSYGQLKATMKSRGQEPAIRQQLIAWGYPEDAVANITGDLLGQASSFFGQFFQ